MQANDTTAWTKNNKDNFCTNNDINMAAHYF